MKLSTQDLVEKQFGKASKKHLKKLLEMSERISLISHDKGKFGRILGELYGHYNEGHPVYGESFNINQQMIDDHHAVEYDGSSKELIEQKHLENRKILQDKGEVEVQGELKL